MIGPPILFIRTSQKKIFLPHVTRPLSLVFENHSGNIEHYSSNILRQQRM